MQQQKDNNRSSKLTRLSRYKFVNKTLSVIVSTHLLVFFFLFSLSEAYFLDDMILLKFGERISQKNNTNLVIHINLNLKLNQFLYGCTLILIEHEQRISDYALCFNAIMVRALLQSVKLIQYKYIITFNSRA